MAARRNDSTYIRHTRGLGGLPLYFAVTRDPRGRETRRPLKVWDLSEMLDAGIPIVRA